jgi:hypothetical protein
MDGWISHLESGTDGSSNSTNDEPGNTKTKQAKLFR